MQFSTCIKNIAFSTGFQWFKKDDIDIIMITDSLTIVSYCRLDWIATSEIKICFSTRDIFNCDQDKIFSFWAFEERQRSGIRDGSNIRLEWIGCLVESILKQLRCSWEDNDERVLL